MNWDEKYRIRNRIWGDEPSELAAIAVEYLQGRGLDPDSASVVDLGCGYGRDVEYVRRRLGCRALGIDSSLTAIEMARETAGDGGGVDYVCCDFGETSDVRHDAVLASNLYHLLGAEDRKRLSRAVYDLLKPGGTLFLSALSERDPHHFGEGGDRAQSSGGANRPDVTVSTEAELRQVFDLLEISDLYEHEYREPHAAGKEHHHISWVLVAERP